MNMKDCDKLYLGFRKFIQKEKLRDYDNEFFEKKRHTYKFMIPFIYKYVNVDKLKNKLVNKDDISLFYFFSVYLNKLLVKEPKWLKGMKLLEPTHSYISSYKRPTQF